MRELDGQSWETHVPETDSVHAECIPGGAVKRGLAIILVSKCGKEHLEIRSSFSRCCVLWSALLCELFREEKGWIVGAQERSSFNYLYQS